MPLIRVDMIKGRSRNEIESLLDAIHRAMVAVFKVPARYRYQIVHKHKPSHFVVEDTGLGILRTRNCLVIQVTTGRASGSGRRALQPACPRVGGEMRLGAVGRRRVLDHELGRRLVLGKWPRTISNGRTGF